MNHLESHVGIGDINAPIKIYIENRPPLGFYQSLTTVVPLPKFEVKNIADKAGNHWRKIFNVYAKLLFELDSQEFDRWQQLRDEKLLQANSRHCLLFSPLSISTKPDRDIHIVMGKTYATTLGISQKCHWISNDFAINEKNNTIICPYFDYRQLSNIKISQLARLTEQLRK